MRKKAYRNKFFCARISPQKFPSAPPPYGFKPFAPASCHMDMSHRLSDLAKESRQYQSNAINQRTKKLQNTTSNKNPLKTWAAEALAGAWWPGASPGHLV